MKRYIDCFVSYRMKLHLKEKNKTGGYISKRLLDLIASGSGHWEEGVKFCYKCGKKLQDDSCSDCHISYSKK
jgi:NADH pyrophosphatase NudC (nudix superfamily)